MPSVLPGVEIVVARLRGGRDGSRCAEARSRLLELLASRAGTPAQALRFEKGPQGKPRLVGGGVEFSLSRSEALAAYAFARGCAVGIDVEAIRPIAQADQIAALVFAPSERRAYEALPAPARTAGFLRGWTRTEALAKALGCGLGVPPQALEEALAGWRVCSFRPAPGYAGAVACAREERPA